MYNFVMSLKNNGKALFLDRDGVINEDFGYVYESSKFVFKRGIFKALRGFMKAGYIIVVITNQSGIGRGYYSSEQFFALCDFMCEKFKTHGVKIAKIYHCPHAPEAQCKCRKPNGLMIKKAAEELNISVAKSVMIGDKQSDIEAGLNAGVGLNFKLGNEFKSVLEVYEKLKEQGKL